MSIEPVNSAMTLQAQPVQSAQTARPTVPVDKSANEFKEAASQEAAEAVDNKTVFVDSAGKTDTEGEGGKQQSGEASQKQLKEAVKDLHKKLDNSNNEVMFGVHEATKRVTIKIVDKDTKEVVKEFPPEKTLDMIAKVWEMAGILVDEKR